MTTLTPTDEKNIAVLESFIDDIQEFINRRIIQTATMMTAAKIFSSFTEEKPECELSEDDFVKGFRSAVKAKRITGIVSAKRFGYKPIVPMNSDGSSPIISGETKINRLIKDFESYIEPLQNFIDKYIYGSKYMTAALIYKKFSQEANCNLEEKVFLNIFRELLQNGRITGIAGKRRIGYGRVNSVSQNKKPSEKKVVQAPQDTQDTKNTQGVQKNHNELCEIIIDDRRKIVALDRLNWGLLVRRDSGSWSTEAYFNNSTNMIKSLARRLIDDDLKHMNDFNLVELSEKIEAAEKHIVGILQRILNKESAA